MACEFRLAVGQSPANLVSPQERLAWLENALPSVASEGADLLLLPELFATGYNIGNLVAERAEPFDGPTSIAVSELAVRHGIAIHYGFSEQEGDLIFNAAQCFGPDGMRLGGHRKLAIPPGFERDHFSAGTGCELFTYRGVRIATLICYDAEFPETARRVALSGADLILVPTALGAQWEWVSYCMIPTRAYENGVFLAYANSAGEENGLQFLGQSFIAAPNGKEIARAGAQPEFIYANLQLDMVPAAQTRLPYLVDRALIRQNIG